MAENDRLVTLPILGMTCANCVAAIEKSLDRLDGVSSAQVNLSNERASVAYNPSRVDLQGLVRQVKEAGFGVALGELNLVIPGLSDPADADGLQRRMLTFPGVLQADVNPAAEKLLLRYVPTITSPAELRQEVQKAGFRLPSSVSGESSEDARIARTESRN